MLHFQYSSVINAPVETVWQFHERPDILKILTPPWQPVKIIRREGELEVEAVSEFSLMKYQLSFCSLTMFTEPFKNKT